MPRCLDATPRWTMPRCLDATPRRDTSTPRCLDATGLSRRCDRFIHHSICSSIFKLCQPVTPYCIHTINNMMLFQPTAMYKVGSSIEPTGQCRWSCVRSRSDHSRDLSLVTIVTPILTMIDVLVTVVLGLAWTSIIVRIGVTMVTKLKSIRSEWDALRRHRCCSPHPPSCLLSECPLCPLCSDSTSCTESVVNAMSR